MRAKTTAAVVPTAMRTASGSYRVATVPNMQLSHTETGNSAVTVDSAVTVYSRVKIARQMKFAGLFLLMSPQQASTMMQAKANPKLANIGQIFS